MREFTQRKRMNEPRTSRKHYVKKLRACESRFNFLVCGFCLKSTISVEFRAIRPKLRGKCTFPQNFNTRKLGGILAFYTVLVSEDVLSVRVIMTES